MGIVLCSLFIRRPKPYSSAWDSQSYCRETESLLPRQFHVVLDEERIAHRHVAVIGDVHGCLDELEEMINALDEITYGNCLYIFCGDIINKGPYNKATLDYVRDLGEDAMVVRGNHEDHVIKHYLAWKAEPSHEMKHKYDWITSLTDDDLEYLKELPYTIDIPSLNATVVHAGLNPYLSLHQQSPWSMTKMRNLSGIDIGETVTPCEVGCGYPWASLWPGPRHVYFGHDAVRGLQMYEHATGLDTGCVYGNRLTAKLLTGNKMIIQFPAKYTYVVPKSAQRKVKPQDSS